MTFLVDANLPRKFTWFNSPDFSFAHDCGDAFPDRAIWDYALKNDRIILTRDSDYFHWMIQEKSRQRLSILNFSKRAEKNLKNTSRYIGNKYVI